MSYYGGRSVVRYIDRYLNPHSSVVKLSINGSKIKLVKSDILLYIKESSIREFTTDSYIRYKILKLFVLIYSSEKDSASLERLICC